MTETEDQFSSVAMQQPEIMSQTMQEEAVTPSLPKSPSEITAPKSPEKVLARLEEDKISAVDVPTYDPLVQDQTTPDK